jgi:sensor histidine kinase YesM
LVGTLISSRLDNLILRHERNVLSIVLPPLFRKALISHICITNTGCLLSTNIIHVVNYLFLIIYLCHYIVKKTIAFMCCSSTQRRRGVPSREDASTSWPSSSDLKGHRRTYLTILESVDHALFKMVRYVLLRPLRPELDGQDVEARENTFLSFR